MSSSNKPVVQKQSLFKALYESGLEVFIKTKEASIEINKDSSSFES